MYAAEDEVLGRQVAVKVLHPALAADEDFLRRFQTEARLAAALRHPNVLLVHDWGDDGTAFLVTELLEGGSLKDLLGLGFRATPAQALQLGLEACRGLDHAHRRGLVHRDVKPANLLFDDDARLRVADFGLARAIAEASTTEPLGAVLGTARYASPEQVEGRALDGRSDVYSLALVLVEAITGQVPFAATTSAATLLARLERPLVPPAEVGPLQDALTAAGRSDPEERVDAAGFGRMLKAAAARLDRPAPLPLVRFETVSPADRHESHESHDRHDNSGRTGSTDPTTLPAPYDAEQEDDDQTATAGLTSRLPTGSPMRVQEAEPPPIDLEPAPPRRRRRGRWLLLLVLLAVLAALAAAAAVLQPWRPTVDVPVVVNLDREEAEARLQAAGLSLRDGARVNSESVEAGRVVASQPRRQREGRAVTVTLSDGPEPRSLPAVAGRPADQVVPELESRGLTVAKNPVDSDTVPAGSTLSIEPPPGTAVPRGSTVTITVSAGPPSLPIPELAGKTFDEASASLKAAGLLLNRVDSFSDKIEVGKVTSTDPAAGTAVRPGATVAVTVSKGPDLVTVPKVTDRTPAAAQQAMAAAGLKISATFGPPSGKVFSSEPAAGAKVKRGTSVALYTK